MDKAYELVLKRIGGKAALARAIGVSHQTITYWTRVPPIRVLAVEKATGISREILRPDIYPPEKPRMRDTSRD